MNGAVGGPLTLVLTRRCDRRCGFCPQEFIERDMTADILKEAFASLAPRLGGRPRVKLFGGEPMLRPDLVTLALDEAARLLPGVRVELSTNAGVLARGPGPLAGRANLEVFASRPAVGAAGLPKSVFNLLLTPSGTALETSAAVLRARAVGFSRINFLPAYFTLWTPEKLGGLRRRFDAARLTLRRLAERGRPMEVVNLIRSGGVPLYGEGLVVDSDGEVYSSSLVLARAAWPRRAELGLGRVGGALRTRSRASARAVMDSCFPARISADTRAVDEHLSEFCRSLGNT